MSAEKPYPSAKAPFLEVETIRVEIHKELGPNGSVVLRSAVPLESSPFRITERLVHWADVRPDSVFLAERTLSELPVWRSLTYKQTLERVTGIAQALLNSKVSVDRPVAILSGNSISHALLALACLHAGLPYAPISPAYSLVSHDFRKLKYVVDLLTPGLIFVDDSQQFKHAVAALPRGIETIDTNALNKFAATKATPAVERAYQNIQPATIAKVLFTSGSTGLPKGVINTHQNITSNWQQITLTFPFLKNHPEIIDWLPWNHTFGGNHNFGLALYNGGSLYIDNGNATPEGIRRTAENLKGRKPTVYFNVPKGFEQLIPYFRNGAINSEDFFANLKMFFYAGAGMAQHIWDELESISVEATGKKILIGTGLGCTESSPSALFASDQGGFAGLLGVPVPGLELKLVPRDGKYEAYYKGPNIFPGYWRQPDLTRESFDSEGFYRTGDALKFADPDNISMGMLFMGRFAEDFKLDSGTWVNVGALKARLIAEGNGWIQDAVITGHDRSELGAIVIPSLAWCANKLGIDAKSDRSVLSHHPTLLNELRSTLRRFAAESTGATTFIRRALIADFTLSIDKGELTDKGTINQRRIIEEHGDVVERLYEGGAGVVEIETHPQQAKT